jgi:tight adherence protein C
MWIVIVIVIILVGLAGVLVYIGIRHPAPDEGSILQQRLDDFVDKGENVSLENLEMAQPFRERVVYPVARKLGELAIKFTPQNALNSIQRKLELAGNPPGIDPTIFLAIQMVFGVLLSGVFFAVFTFGQTKLSLFLRIVLVIVIFLLGYYLPSLWISSKISKRQRDVRKQMPDALDLLTICVEAGLGFDYAMAKVVDKWKNEISKGFARVLQEMQLGKTRREALRDMAERINITEMTSFVASIIQSEQLGVSMSKVLHIQAEQMRTRRRQYAEEEAHKAPTKMLLPMVGLIFPALLVVLLTPAILQLMHSNLAGVFGNVKLGGVP